MLRIGQSLIKPAWDPTFVDLSTHLISSTVFSDSDDDSMARSGDLQGGSWDNMGYNYDYNVSFWFMPTADASGTDGTHSATIFEVTPVNKSVKISYVDGAGDSEKLVVSHGTGSAYADSTVDYDLEHNKWYHISIGYDYSSYDLEVYINGNLEYTNTSFARCASGGSAITLCDGNFTGNITQFIVHIGTQSPEDSWGLTRYARKLYNNGYGTNPLQLIKQTLFAGQLHAYWPLNSNHAFAGTDGVHDLSGHGNHLTSTNMVDANFASTELPSLTNSGSTFAGQFEITFDGASSTEDPDDDGRTLYDDQHCFGELSSPNLISPVSARDFSIAIWFKTDYTGSGYQALIDISSGANGVANSIRMGLVSRVPYFNLDSVESADVFTLGETWAGDHSGTAPSSAFSDDTWSLYTVTFEYNASGSDDTITIYNNASSNGTVTHDISSTLSDSGVFYPRSTYDPNWDSSLYDGITARMHIGRLANSQIDGSIGKTRLSGNSGNFKGSISAIGVWDDKCLSPTEVATIYNSGVQANWRNVGPSANLNYYWTFGDGPEGAVQWYGSTSSRSNFEVTSYGDQMSVIKNIGVKGDTADGVNTNIYLNKVNKPTIDAQVTD